MIKNTETNIDCNGTKLKRGDVLIKCQAPCTREEFYIYTTKIMRCSCNILKEGISDCSYTSFNVDQDGSKYLYVGYSKEFMKNYEHSSICWDCNLACMGSISPCEWARTLEKPVPGWEAIKTLTEAGKTTYNVFKCPKFVKFKRRNNNG